MKTYVKKMIRLYYKSTWDVRNDHELQDYVADVAYNRLGWTDGNRHGMPKKIKTIDICLSVMFTSSAQHAAVNFGQYETYRFVPYCPLSMRVSPHKKGEATMERTMQSLPDAKTTLIAVGLPYTLSSHTDADVIEISNGHPQVDIC